MVSFGPFFPQYEPYYMDSITTKFEKLLILAGTPFPSDQLPMSCME